MPRPTFDQYLYDNKRAFHFGRCIASTPKAILVRLDTYDEVWIPHTQITADSDVWREGQEGFVFVTSWFARQCGWIA